MTQETFKAAKGGISPFGPPSPLLPLDVDGNIQPVDHRGNCRKCGAKLDEGKRRYRYELCDRDLVIPKR